MPNESMPNPKKAPRKRFTKKMISLETVQALSRSTGQHDRTARMHRAEEVCVSLFHDLGIDNPAELEELLKVMEG